MMELLQQNEENRISLFNPEAEKIFHRIKYESFRKKTRRYLFID